MAPNGRKAGADAGLRKRRGVPTQNEESEDEDEILDSESNGRWTDSFIVLCAARWTIEKAISFYKSRQNGASTPMSNGKKKAEKEEVPLKQAALEWASNFKIPVFLLILCVLTSMLIAGGENFGHGEEKSREAVDDFYGALGVTRDADQADVKRAYKTLAKRWHPDKNPNCSTCQETFSKIAVAYETLADDKKRATYDESGGIATTELKSPRSVPLTRENFDELVTFSNDVWIVQLFRPDDGSCAQFHPFWENQIQKNGHLVRFGRVDISKDQGKWLPVKARVLPMVLKYARHLTGPEIFPITAIHEMPQQLQKFVITSFPNIGLPMNKDKYALKSWIGGSTRRHKVLFAIPGKSEEERYKSHLVPRKLAARWSEIFEFRTAETAALHKLPADAISDEVRAALPPANASAQQASIVFFAAGSGGSAGSGVRAAKTIPWPTGEDEMVLQLLALTELAAPTLSARSAELLCRSLAIRRVYCLIMLDPADVDIARAIEELRDSRKQYTKEVEEIRASGGDVTEDEDNFVVHALRLFRQPRGLQPSIATCNAPKFGQVENILESSKAFLMDMDTNRLAALKGISSFRGIYPQIAYEDSLAWADDALHPFLSLPDCDEGMLQHLVRTLRAAPVWELLVQLLTVLLLVEATAKGMMERSLKWTLGACALVLLLLLRSPPFLRRTSAYLPYFLFAPPVLIS